MGISSYVRALRKGLPMDEASRLQRAKELGYTEDVFHGSMHDISKFSPKKTSEYGDYGQAIYTSTSPKDVNANYTGAPDSYTRGVSDAYDEYGTPPPQNEGVVYPLKIRNPNPILMGFGDKDTKIDAPKYRRIFEKYLDDTDTWVSNYNGDEIFDPSRTYLEIEQALREMGFEGDQFGTLYKKLGHSGVTLNAEDRYGSFSSGLTDLEGATHHVIFDPKNIRSKFARFDPANEGKSDILGAADPDLLSAMNAGTYLGSNLPEGTPTGQEPGAKDYLTMLLRGTVQGTAADALSGLYGLAHGGDVQKIQEAQDALGYEPEGAEAQAASNLGELLAPIMEPISNAVDWVGDRSPIAGAVLQSAPVVAGLPAALRAGRTVNRAANRVLAEELRRPSGAKSAQRGHFRYFDYTNEPSESRAAARSALKELDENGVPAAEVWKQYGWGREPVTNRPITEISDSRLEVPSIKLYRGPDGGTLLFGARKGDTGEHLLKDSILQGEAYLKYLDPNYKIRGNRQKNLGSATHYAPFATESGLIEMGPQASYADFMDVLVHELNHGMQSRFGAPRGGSPEQFGYKDFEKKYFDADEEYRNHIESLMDKLPAPLRAGISSGNVTPEILGRRDSQIIQNAGRLPPDPEIQRILIESLRAMEQKKLFKSEMRGARKKYENLHGEAMSRLAQNRRNLDPQLIRALYPFEPKYFQQQTGTDIGDLDVRF